MRILSLIAVVVFVSSLAGPARAGMFENCDQDRDLKRLIKDRNVSEQVRRLAKKRTRTAK